jgi:hypothetical protein
LPKGTPVGPPFSLTSNPFVAGAEAGYVVGADSPSTLVTAKVRRLTACHTDPLTWGAVGHREVGFASTAHPTVTFNEYVLRFADSTRARQALHALAGQLAACPTQPGQGFEEGQAAGRPAFDQSYVTQRDQYASASPARDAQPTSTYALLAARRGNVVIVLEDVGYPTDRSAFRLDIAFQRALA